MLQNIIQYKKNLWLNSASCPVSSLLQYIRQKGEMRDTQIEAIETYLFLKIAGENKPLWKLFSEGFFNSDYDIAKLNINELVRNEFKRNSAALALYLFASQKINGKSRLETVEKAILDSPEKVEYEKIIQEIFYDVSYSDYLFSLPMGAGKTYLMAAFMYLDLYFAISEPFNKNFAHNFIVLVPSGLKSSIVPSLKTIEKFDPTWILSEPAASEIKRQLKFEILDQAKTPKKSNKAKNPNAQKINQHLSNSDLKGLILVVNAEKVILDRIDAVKIGKTFRFDFHETAADEQDKQANELRNLIGKIPNLQILIDEVHHAKGNITSVLGFSGTPYLDSPDKIRINDSIVIQFPQITNTVYYYPLILAVKKFLKKPIIQIAERLGALDIIERGIEDFYKKYKNTIYANGAIAKLGIYCGNIERLEEEIFPFIVNLIKKFGDNESHILRYHRGNKKHKISKEVEKEYSSLDLKISQKRIVLLVQIGKEGWDCKSLTGVILSQQGDCPKNMVLQTSCRCLRQVDKDKVETAVIWLNDENAKILNQQLATEQNTSIKELNNVNLENAVEFVQRFPRVEQLQLPPIDFYQMKVGYTTTLYEDEANTEIKLKKLLHSIKRFKNSSTIKTVENLTEVSETEVVGAYGTNNAHYYHWLLDVAKGSCGSLHINDLEKHNEILTEIFKACTFKKDDQLYFNNQFDIKPVNSEVRIAFWIKRDIGTKQEVIHKETELLIIEKLTPIEKNEKLYPSEFDVKAILSADNDSKTIDELENALEEVNRTIKEAIEKQGLLIPNQPQALSNAVKSKNLTFHYLPYNFVQSGLEKNILEHILTLKEFKQRNLEIYYNGERGLTNFVIQCFGKNGKFWKSIGKYTPDFLLVQRKKKQLYKILIVEIKGKGFQYDKTFLLKKDYVSSEFLRLNEEKFGYKRFEFSYIPEQLDDSKKLELINNTLVEFFN